MSNKTWRVYDKDGLGICVLKWKADTKGDSDISLELKWLNVVVCWE